MQKNYKSIWYKIIVENFCFTGGASGVFLTQYLNWKSFLIRKNNCKINHFTFTSDKHVYLFRFTLPAFENDIKKLSNSYLLFLNKKKRNMRTPNLKMSSQFFQTKFCFCWFFMHVQTFLLLKGLLFGLITQKNMCTVCFFLWSNKGIFVWWWQKFMFLTRTLY